MQGRLCRAVIFGVVGADGFGAAAPVGRVGPFFVEFLLEGVPVQQVEDEGHDYGQVAIFFGPVWCRRVGLPYRCMDCWTVGGYRFQTGSGR